MTKESNRPQDPTNTTQQQSYQPEKSLIQKDNPDDFSPEREAAPDARKQTTQRQ